VPDIDELLPVLACPTCRTGFRRMVDELTCRNGHTFPVVGGVPVFLPQGRGVQHRPGDHVSHQMSPEIAAVFVDLQGPWLHLGAGASAEHVPGSIELETVVFVNTDVVGDGAALPFATGSLSGCLALNVFEHLPRPQEVADEINRVLTPGAPLVVQTAFLQPLHSDPGHFFNATEQGVRQWFSGFDIEAVTVPDNMHPAFALSWIASDLLFWSPPELREELGAMTLAELAAQWSDPAARVGPSWESLWRFPAEHVDTLAAGFEIRARAGRSIESSAEGHDPA
jgi:SAM-dependent methyltransferase